MPIVQATDLGSVQVLKHGNRFLLTDSFGDIHPDSRGLGLYDGDTRVLACSVLRIGGMRPVLLQASVGANYRGGDPDDQSLGRPEPGRRSIRSTSWSDGRWASAATGCSAPKASPNASASTTTRRDAGGRARPRARAPTAPTSSRCVAIPDPAEGDCCPSR